MDLVVNSLEDDKAKDVIVIDLSGKSDIPDYLVGASGTSGSQVVAIDQHLRERSSHAGITGIGREGITSG